MVEMLTVPVSTISNSQVFLLKKNVGSVYAIFNDQNFNDTIYFSFFCTKTDECLLTVTCMSHREY